MGFSSKKEAEKGDPRLEDREFAFGVEEHETASSNNARS